MLRITIVVQNTRTEISTSRVYGTITFSLCYHRVNQNTRKGDEGFCVFSRIKVTTL